MQRAGGIPRADRQGLGEQHRPGIEAFDATYPALVTCAGVTLALRAGSLVFGWRLPNYRSRPPRK
jgi:hypothetical protein